MVASVIHAFDDIELIYLNQLVWLACMSVLVLICYRNFAGCVMFS